MSNTIRIRRRASGNPGAPSSLENAEIAFNEVNDTLYYGKGTGGADGTATTVEAIGGSGTFVDKATAQTITGVKTFSSGITADVTGTVSDISNHDTGDLTEGSNLYYTDARARSAISASGSLSYSPSTGVISFNERTNTEIRSLFSAGGDLSYDAATGTFSFTETDPYTSADFDADFSAKTTDDLTQGTTNVYYSDSLVDSHLSGGTGVTYNSGNISIGQDVSPTSDVTFNDVTVDGDLVVNGTTTTVNTETVTIADNIIQLNSDFTGTSPTESAGFVVNRDAAGDKTFVWDESVDKWSVGSETFVAGTFEGDLTGNASTANQLSTARTISVTGDLSGSTSFDGSSNVSISASVQNDSHSHTLSTISDSGTMAAQDASNVDINGGTIDGITLDGGTF